MCCLSLRADCGLQGQAAMTDLEGGERPLSLALDAAVVLIFISVIYRAYKKGFVRTVVGLAGTIAAYIAAFLFCHPVGDWIDSTFMRKYVNNTIDSFAANNGAANPGLYSTAANGSVSSFDIANEILSQFGAKVTDALITAVSVPLSTLISRSIAFFIILAACMFVVGIITHMLNAIFKLPILGSLNAIAGAAVGVIEAVVILAILSTLMSLILSMCFLQGNQPISINTIESTHIFKYVYNANPLTYELLKT